MKTITLTNEEYDELLIMIGYAAGSAGKMGNMELRNNFLRLLNRINEGNPNWTPYEVEP